MQSLYIREFGKIIKGEENQQGEKNQQENPKDNIQKITLKHNAWDFLSNHASSSEKDDGFIEFVNSTTLKVKNFVGVITTPDGTQIEILPKIEEVADDKSADKSRKTLERMLKVVNLNDLRPLQTTEASLKLQNRPLPEVLIGWFLNAVDKIIKQGIRRDYLRVQGHEKFLKGQLQTHKQLNDPPHKQYLFHIEYDILSPNRPENRLIHSALLQVLRWSKDNENQRMAKHFLIFLDEVPDSENVENDFEQWSSGRDMNYYKPALIWLKWILNQQSPFALKDKNQGISFLLPMEKLFEKYVAKILAKNLSKGKVYQLTAQSTDKHLSSEPKAFALRPDMLIKKDNETICILDTKWKLINENETYESGNVDEKKGISQSDMYQLFAYGKKYDVKKVVLIYPKWECFQGNKIQFKLDISSNLDNKLNLDVVHFSLDDDKIIDFNLKKLFQKPPI